MPDIIVIGASAGGVEELVKLTESLPPSLSAAIFVVVHINPEAPGFLPKILQRRSTLKIQFPQPNDQIEHGRMYIAPPDHHMLLSPSGVHLSRGPRVNRLRPSVDALFCSAARAFGPRVIGVVLSGTGSDGTLGLHTIREHGGVTVIQDPEEALFSGMPAHALDQFPIDYVLSTSQMADLFERLTSQSRQDKGEPVREEQNIAVNEYNDKENRELKTDKEIFELDGNDGTPRMVVTCPDCGGVLWEAKNGKMIHYECQIGHTYSEESVYNGQGERLEESLWTAVRALDERAALSKRLANRAEQRGHPLSQQHFMRQAEEAEKNAGVIRQIVTANHVTIPEREKTD